MTDKMPKLPTDRHFLFLSESCLYIVRLGQGASHKNSGNIGLFKTKPQSGQKFL